MTTSQIIESCKIGDVLCIVAGDIKRTVTVTEITDRCLYTTSGATIERRFRGGMIHKEWLTYQPTMRQRARTISTITRHALIALSA